MCEIQKFNESYFPGYKYEEDTEKYHIITMNTVLVIKTQVLSTMVK